jgi:hypothetical protein
MTNKYQLIKSKRIMDENIDNPNRKKTKMISQEEKIENK